MTRVFINPGHAPNGSPDPGAVNRNTGLRECDITRDIGDAVASFLTAADLEAQVMQSDDLNQIVNATNEWNSDIFVSIHCDSASNEWAGGTTTYIYNSPAESSVNLANCVQKQLIDTMKLYDRGVRQANFCVVRETNMPAILVETAFISNDEEAELLANPEERSKIAAAIARGITDYFTSIK